MEQPGTQLAAPARTRQAGEILPPENKAIARRKVASVGSGGRIVESTVKGLKPSPEGNRVIWDSALRGFGVRVTPAGVVSFILNYRIHGRQRRITIGGFPELSAAAARDEASDLRNQIRKGHDPLEEREKDRNEPTMHALIDDYLQSDLFLQRRSHTQREYRRMIEKIIRKKLGSRRLKAINARDIQQLRVSLAETPYQANRVLALLSRMFTYAIKEKWISENPAKDTERCEEKKREACLTVDQIKAFRTALDGYKDQNAANALRLLLLTGARSGETLKAKWEEFDLDRGTWTKPSHHTKQKKTEHVPLSAPALELLRRMRGKNASGPLFPGKGEDGNSRVTLRRVWLQVCKNAGLATETTKKGKRRTIKKYSPTVRIHDLRHTYASHLVSAGVSLQIVGGLLGHTQPQTTMRYAHLQDDSLRNATNQYARVIAFGRKRA
ncbi:MAG TPA: site-specific integrase [Acidobacteriaceae bacterium]|nr:site-specific integrase [Acidobacteriaceae bacterium]